MRPFRIALTAGEPAGIGPELLIQLAQRRCAAQLIAIADADLLAERAAHLGMDIKLRHWSADLPLEAHRAGELWVMHEPLRAPSTAGQLSTDNVAYVLATLDRAVDGCQAGHFDAMVTGPVHKAVISRAGTPFSGHTEYLAARCRSEQVLMLLTADTLRVALLTTHLPLRDVPAALTAERLEQTLTLLHAELQKRCGIETPRIGVLGLNPHAGEEGELGDEEWRIMRPVLEQLREAGMQLEGPLPADTAFTPKILDRLDAVLAMYHDQGLPVLKYAGFGRAVNITLGLPIIRTSVDHGTALDIAGTGQADTGSFSAALDQAIILAGVARRGRG
jgi:4-hydroxythreonine-4-phosphate dehydrogenase